MQYNKQYKDIYKIANTILFFIENDMHHFGITKLMKLFFYADKYHLEKYKKTIFSSEYTKLEHGPVPQSTLTLLHEALSLKLENGYPLEYEEEAKIINQFIDINAVRLDNNNKMIKFKIKDNTGSRGREWFKKLERKKEARNNNVNTSNNNGCYLTTACTEYMGLKDDCYELEMLRSFRDTYVKSLSNGDELIMQYYNDAPKILFEISKSKDKDVVFTSIYQTIEEITRYILLEKYEDAYISYQCMYKVLEVNYLGNRKCKIV